MLETLTHYSPTPPKSHPSAYQFSRRYSDVVMQVSILALDILFLASKLDVLSPEIGHISLFCLSFVGVLSLHYSLDEFYKLIEDTYVSFKMDNAFFTLLSAAKTVRAASGTGLLVANCIASTVGLWNPTKEMEIFKNITGWGEATLLAGFLLLFVNLAVTKWTKNNLHNLSPSQKAAIRCCMQKDVLWDMLDVQPLENNALTIIKDHLTTQLRVNYGGSLALVIGGDALQAVEKWKTPDSRTSAFINCGVAFIYTLRMAIEKLFEIHQRDRIETS
ncbi:MAG: hypothetical protein KDK65_01980 [Chlamydiia bacterium]|nr:hypothetical protein [Chlamydiia bacterium]